MKFKKFLLPTITFIVAVILMVTFVLIYGISKKPAITESSFPFTITYEIDGTKHTIDDVYKAYYSGNGGYTDTKSRYYDGVIEGVNAENETAYQIYTDEKGYVMLYTNLYPDYLMGDPIYDYSDDSVSEPQIFYYEKDMGYEHSVEEALPDHEIKLVSWEYAEPITNSLVFSHISHMNGETVLPLMLIALVALIVILVAFKKEAELQYKPIDKISIVFNFIVGIIAVPFLAIMAMLTDIIGSDGDFWQQIIYLVPTISLLSIAVSVTLRRRGYSKSGFIVQLIGPAIFIIIYFLSLI